MNLEDHLGDIIRKARRMTNVPAAAAAKAARLTEAELSSLEDSGIFAKQPDFQSLAGGIGLNPTKLESIAKGWLPAKCDLRTWRQFRVGTTSGDGITVNCYLAWDETTREAALFDTGFEAAPILDTVAKEKLLLRDIFITHSHHDHIAALVDVRTALPQCRVHGHSRKVPAEQRLKAGETFQVGRLKIGYRETPGHAADGVTYLISDWPNNVPQVAIVGDTIFAGSMGSGNDSWQVARQKVREHILSLPPDTLLCPGHGPLTTVAEEQANNPFF
ncbi:MAG TPA: MBL fold metallo-hydrolase [Verrucomicrobiae bacterium]|nr:MBL fold metallo-hydrolase [Verrucomicrobiae bacterium]